MHSLPKTKNEALGMSPAEFDRMIMASIAYLEKAHSEFKVRSEHEHFPGRTISVNPIFYAWENPSIVQKGGMLFWWVIGSMDDDAIIDHHGVTCGCLSQVAMGYRDSRMFDHAALDDRLTELIRQDERIGSCAESPNQLRLFGLYQMALHRYRMDKGFDLFKAIEMIQSVKFAGLDL